MLGPDEIELREDMTAEERIIVLIRQFDIRLGKEFCYNDPVDYNKTKGQMAGLNLASEQIKIAAKRDIALLQEVTNYLRDEVGKIPRMAELMAEEIMVILDAHRVIDVNKEIDSIRMQLKLSTTARNVIYAELCALQKKIEAGGF